MFKRTLQILAGVAFVVQLAGCIFWDHDDRWRHDHQEHHDDDDHGHDSGIDVHLHG